MRSEPILARVIRWGLWSSALVPLIIFNNYIVPFHFGKVVVFRSLIEVVLALYLILIWQDRSYRPKIGALGWALIAFAGVYTITAITSVAPYISFWGTLDRMGGLFSFWHYIVFYLMLIGVLRTKQHWRVFLDLLIGAGVISAVYGFFQFLGVVELGPSTNRPYGTIGNAGLFAGYQLLIVFLAATLSIQENLSHPGQGCQRQQAKNCQNIFVCPVRFRRKVIGECDSKDE